MDPVWFYTSGSRLILYQLYCFLKIVNIQLVTTFSNNLTSCHMAEIPGFHPPWWLCHKIKKFHSISVSYNCYLYTEGYYMYRIKDGRGKYADIHSVGLLFAQITLTKKLCVCTACALRVLLVWHVWFLWDFRIFSVRITCAMYVGRPTIPCLNRAFLLSFFSGTAQSVRVVSSVDRSFYFWPPNVCISGTFF